MDLPPSKLGTKEYWDEFYALENKNYRDNPEDSGECWFSESGAEEKVVEYIMDLGGSPSVLDLGTGNGRLLFSLRDEGVSGEFLGVDYSPTSVEFAQNIAKTENYDVTFQQVDFMANPDWTDRKFDIVLDKGTLDAIALSGLDNAAFKYAAAAIPLARPGGLFIITSCNFTEQELAKVFDRPYETIEYPKFEFGGQQGSTVTTLIFQM